MFPRASLVARTRPSILSARSAFDTRLVCSVISFRINSRLWPLSGLAHSDRCDMRALVTTSLALAALVSASAFTPASADSAIVALRDTEGLSNGRFPAMDQVDCVVPYCVANPDGSLNHQASTEALERAQNYNKR